MQNLAHSASFHSREKIAPGTKQLPPIVVIHEAFGLVEHERDIARRFANIGYDDALEVRPHVR
jgi:dienelactone hydrolase